MTSVNEPRDPTGADDPWATWRRALPSGWFPWWPGPSGAAVPGPVSSQSILPNWNFGTVVNVTEQNSAAPATEAAILQTYSYGRQLGRIADALQVLVDERRGPRNRDLDTFVDMKRRIDLTKDGMADARLQQFRDDLAQLGERDGAAFAELRREVLRTLDEEGGTPS
ncbi:MAG: hypothetical protein QOK35_3258 [Pseudonocardiales bacterium]|nr:hypothetical protein [Pseudonocardiales bacterium]